MWLGFWRCASVTNGKASEKLVAHESDPPTPAARKTGVTLRCRRDGWNNLCKSELDDVPFPNSSCWEGGSVLNE